MIWKLTHGRHEVEGDTRKTLGKEKQKLTKKKLKEGKDFFIMKGGG